MLNGSTPPSAPTTRIAIIVDPSLPIGLLANTVATLSIGLGAAEPRFGNTVLTDREGRSIHNSADRPVPILQATPEVIRSLLLTALASPLAGTVVAFPQFARSLHAFEDYLQKFPQTDLAQETIDGLALAGSERWVKSLTGNLRLLR